MTIEHRIETGAAKRDFPSERLSCGLAVLSLLLFIGVCVFARIVAPENGRRPLVAICVLLAIALLMELHWRNFPNQRAAQSHRRVVRVFFAVAVMTVTVRYGINVAASADLVDLYWREFGIRLANIGSGAGLAFFGNYLPKLVSPWTLENEPFDWQGVHRFCGHAFFFSGSACAIFWLMLPVYQAKLATAALFLVVAVAAVVRKFYSLATWQRHRDSLP